MNLTTLTHRDALCLNARFTSREEGHPRVDSTSCCSGENFQY